MRAFRGFGEAAFWALLFAGTGKCCIYQVPTGPLESFLMELGSGTVEVIRNTRTGSVTDIIPQTKTKIMPSMGTEEEAWEEAMAFIEAHPEMFAGTTSGDLRRSRVRWDAGYWSISARQYYGGVEVFESVIAIRVRGDGYLSLLRAALFPPAELARIELQPSVTGEEAQEIALAWHEAGEPGPYAPQLVIGFPYPCYEPTLLWRVHVRADSWMALRYAIAADTGETIAVEDLVTDGTRIGDAFLRGDANDDGRVDIADPLRILMDLFGETGYVECADADDANDDGKLDIADPIYVLQYIFFGGDEPPSPFPVQGPDLTHDRLACDPRRCLRCLR